MVAIIWPIWPHAVCGWGEREPKEASAEIQAELDNVRLAWQWAATQGRLAELEQATYGWWQFCQFQGLEAEGRQSFAVAIAGVRQQLAADRAGCSGHVVGAAAARQAVGDPRRFSLCPGTAMRKWQRRRVRRWSLGAASGGVEGETFGTFVLGRALQELEQYQREPAICGGRPFNSSSAINPTIPRANCCTKRTGWRITGCAGARSTLAIMPAAAPIWCRRCSMPRRWASDGVNSIACTAWARLDFLLFDFAAAEPSFGRRSTWRAP